ncbi:hypothetical protein Tco_1000014, partial [Tanacetum coccineum]
TQAEHLEVKDQWAMNGPTRKSEDNSSTSGWVFVLGGTTAEIVSCTAGLNILPGILLFQMCTP